MELEKLIQVVLTTDKHAYEEIIKHYYSLIYHYVYQQVGDVEVSRELCQDIFFEAYRSLKRYNAKKSSFQTWLYKIANYRCIDYLRSKDYRQQVFNGEDELKVLSEPTDDALTRLLKEEKAQKINHLMRTCLKAKHERVMRYYFYADLSPKEIATLEKTSVKTIYTIIKRSLDKLRIALGGKDDE